MLSGPLVRRGAAGDRARGAWVQFDVRVCGSAIQAVRFLAFGCPHVIAVADWIAHATVGRKAEARLPESVAALRDRFDVPVAKLGRLLIIEDAWIAAVSSPYPE